MALPVYSRRFIAQSGITLPLRQAVPAGKLWILRDLDARVTAGSLPAALFVGSGTPDLYFIVLPWTSSTTESVQWSGRQVIPAGAELLLTVSSGSTWSAAISGYELTLP